MKLKRKNDILPAEGLVKKSRKAKVVSLPVAIVKKEKKETIPFWNPCVAVWFEFTKSKKNGVEPTFCGPSQSGLKHILKELMNRAVKDGVVWTEEEAKSRLLRFLSKAHRIEWLRKNWLLKNINGQKDNIFFQKDQNTTNGKNFGSLNQQSSSTEVITSRYITKL